MKRITKLCFIALAFLLMVAPLLACGGAETPSTPPESTGNQSPEITSLTAEEATVTPTAETKITCVASDPDGDTLTYSWEAHGGDITGTEKTVTWQAPDFTGEFEVKVTVDDGQGGTETKSCTIIVLATQRPVISSLTAEPATLQPDETSTITCTASDPDGDTLTYTWTASGGTITGIGKTVTWKAPSITGEFLISVKVDDGKGGITESSCSIVVAIPEITLILTPLADESGSVYFDGDIYQYFRIGDNDQNVGVRPYFSFDITGLAGAEIDEATLTFTVKQKRDNPFSISPWLYVDNVYYGTRQLKPSDFFLPTLSQIAQLDQQPPAEVNVIERLNIALQDVSPRLQVRLRLGPPDSAGNNLNSLEDYIEFSEVELIVTYVK